MTPRIVLAGRPNVGKSTLFNRLYGKKKALVSDISGLTRDFREELIHYNGLEFLLIDTAGVYEAKADELSRSVESNALKVITSSDLCLLVVDGRIGITSKDIEFSTYLRKSGINTITIVNKSESGIARKNIFEFYELGFGEPIPISAEHNIGILDLIEKIKEYVPKSVSIENQIDEIMKLAIIGKPNVGKSTLLNSLFGEKRMLTGDYAGTTRDSIEINWEWNGQKITLIDTAGLRRKSRVNQLVEKLTYADSIKTIKFADVIILLIDAVNFIDKQDMRLADYVISEGRALLIVINKFDLIKDKREFNRRLNNMISTNLPQLNGDNVLKISSINRSGIKKMMNRVVELQGEWTQRISTAKLNSWLREIIHKHQPPAKSGRRIKLRYITQASVKPPTFVIFSSYPEALPNSYKKYLINELRGSFDYSTTPIRLYFRKGDNPYSK
ncbi:MAG: ribosome biogenesis GTPase Der [Hyphomicrobiales bacterium]|jgi:GTPase|nr:ribosome biogenesis GTPase Der [Hyphomicrobiales bacterium]